MRAGELVEDETPKVSPLEFLKAVYHDEGLPLGVRMKAAMACLPFEHPKLAVTATFTGEDFASALDRAVARSGASKMIELKPIADAE